MPQPLQGPIPLKYDFSYPYVNDSNGYLKIIKFYFALGSNNSLEIKWNSDMYNTN